ncbi:MAG: HipA family kinase [Rhodospirillales bacterium]
MVIIRIVKAIEIVRKMRGGAQACLVRTDGNEFFVAKALDNPQHPRVVVNEVVGNVVLRHLGVTAPEPALVHIPPETLTLNHYFELVEGRKPMKPGVYFGSRYPCDPASATVYDFLPNRMLPKVANLRDFCGVVVFDKWVDNIDHRQAVFSHSNCGFRAHMIDEGGIFGGPTWRFHDDPRSGLYRFAPVVYQQVKSLDDFQPWLDRARYFPERILDDVYRALPAEWIDDARRELEALLDQLVARRSRIPDFLLGCRQEQPSLFPNWIHRSCRSAQVGALAARFEEKFQT